jgi:endonuclease YncB( thermonuclease family)
MILFTCCIFVFFCTPFLTAQSYLQKDSLKVKVLRVLDGDTYLVQYRKSEPIKIRLRMPDPHDTVDTFDASPRRALKQSVRLGITIDSVQKLAKATTLFVDSLIISVKGSVILRKYEDQIALGRQFSYDRLLRGVEVRGRHLGEILRERGLSVEKLTRKK